MALVLVDDFETGILNELYLGNTDDFDVVSTNSPAGTYSLSTISTPDLMYRVDDFAQMEPSDSNAAIRCLMNVTGVKSTILSFGVQDANNYYAIDLNTDKRNNIRIVKIVDSVEIELAVSDEISSDIETDFASISVSWSTTGLITVNAYDNADYTSLLATVNTTDTTFIDGGYGVGYTNPGVNLGATRYDNIEINQVPQIPPATIQGINSVTGVQSITI